MLFKFVIYLVIGHGLLNFLVSASLLKFVEIQSVHQYYLSMFIGKQSPIFERVLAYYAFLNGLVRVFGGMNLYQQSAASLVALSYFSEAAFLANELFIHKSMDKSRGQYVIGFLILFGGLSLYNYF